MGTPQDIYIELSNKQMSSNLPIDSRGRRCFVYSFDSIDESQEIIEKLDAQGISYQVLEEF